MDKPIATEFSYQIPGTNYQVEVRSIQPEVDKPAVTRIIIRDLSIPLPEFNPSTLLEDADQNIIHEEWIRADTTPYP